LADDQDPSSKTEDPTQKKLEDAREKGDVIKSQDLATLFLMAGSAIVVLALGSSTAAKLGDWLVAFVERPHQFSMDPGAAQDLAFTVSLNMFLAVGAALGTLFLAAFAGHFVQSGFMWSGEKIKPDLTKLSPIKGFGRLFGGEAWVQFAKNIVKIIGVAIVCWVVLWPHMESMKVLVRMEPAALVPVLFDAASDLFWAVLISVALVSGVDYVLQRQAFLKRNRMSKRDMMDEYKQSEGDPHVKAKLRQIRQEKGRRRMMAKVPEATVIITNPTHYAVALQYDPAKGGAPVCVAKGVDRVALKIREIAKEAGVTIMEDPPLARALYATVDLDEAIPAEQYQAVAKIISIVLGLAKNKRSAMGAR